MGDIGRLQKWAQEEIRGMQIEINSLKQQLARARHEAGPSNVWISGHTMNPDLPLGMNVPIRFQFHQEEGRVTQRFIDVRHEYEQAKDRDSLVVQGDSTIFIVGYATNSIRLILSRR
jgi:hypothetical protein